MEEFRVHAQGADRQLVPRHTEESRGHFGAILRDGMAFFRDLAYEPPGNCPEDHAAQPFGVPKRRLFCGQSKNRSMVMAPRKQLVLERRLEQRGVERYPADRGAGLHDIRPNRFQFLPGARWTGPCSVPAARGAAYPSPCRAATKAIPSANE